LATFLLSWLASRYAALEASVFLREQPGAWLVLESVPGSPRRATEPLATRLALHRDRPHFTLGSDPSADLVVGDPAVAPVHAILERRDDGGWTLRCASAEARALLDGLPVSDFPVALGSGARIDLGDVRLTYYTGPDFHERLLEGLPTPVTPSGPPPRSPAPPR